MFDSIDHGSGGEHDGDGLRRGALAELGGTTGGRHDTGERRDGHRFLLFRWCLC